MSPHPSPMRRWRSHGWIPWLLPWLLAGCATTSGSRIALTVDQQRDFLQSLAAFSFNGRATIDGQLFSMEWQQQREVATVRLTSRVGVGGVRMEYSPQHLRLETSRGVLNDDEARQLLAGELGFVPPFESFRYWVLGLPAPGSPAVQDFDADGRLQQLEQQGWLITYRKLATVGTAGGTASLPSLLNATRDDLGLRLVIDRWSIR